MSMLDEKTHLGPYNLGALTHRTLSSRTPSCSSVEETPEKKQNIPQALRKAMAHPAIPEKITKAFEGAIIKGDFQYTDRGNIWVISIGKAEHTRTFELQKQPMAL